MALCFVVEYWEHPTSKVLENMGKHVTVQVKEIGVFWLNVSSSFAGEQSREVRTLRSQCIDGGGETSFADFQENLVSCSRHDLFHLEDQNHC